MKTEVVLSIRGTQRYDGVEPDVIELVTTGTLEFRDGGWDISYEESALTGMDGVTTTFRVEPARVILDRSGRLRSRMVFEKGVRHESLYQMELGTLLMAVCAQSIFFDITPEGGMIDLVYTIDIENTQAGVVDYHLDIRAK